MSFSCGDIILINLVVSILCIASELIPFLPYSQGRMILAHLCDEPKGLKTSMCMVCQSFYLTHASNLASIVCKHFYFLDSIFHSCISVIPLVLCVYCWDSLVGRYPIIQWLFIFYVSLHDIYIFGCSPCCFCLLLLPMFSPPDWMMGMWTLFCLILENLSILYHFK